MSGSEDHGRIRELFDELSATLDARGVRGDVYLVVVGAQITGYVGDRTRKDVGASTRPRTRSRRGENHRREQRTGR